MSGPTLGMRQQLRQQMTLAPQLRQSLELLQVPILELRAMIQREMESNPVLDEMRTGDISIEAARDEADRAAESDIPVSSDLSSVNALEGAGEEREKLESESDRELDEILRLDEEWRDYFYQDGGSQEQVADIEERRQFFFDSIVQSESFQEHLLMQLELADLDLEDSKTVEMLIGSLDDSGYLSLPLAEIAQGAGMELEHVESLLAVVQDMTPSGVGARDLRECLLIQLRHLQRDDVLAADLVRDCLELVAGRKYAEAAQVCGVTEDEVREAVEEISGLDPKPGLSFSSEAPVYVSPEMEVFLREGRYVVVVDDTQLPHVRISKRYRRLLEDPSTTAETRSYIRERIRAGMFLIKSIHQRQDTIRRIATAIVDAQQDFFANGVSDLQPLTMAEIAAEVGVHETTVSRTVANKYMRSPRGVLELRFFFTHGIKTADGDMISNRTVQDRIARIVASEDASKPYSDQEILDILKKDGVKIARRTVAKYRVILKIPPSHRRRI